MELGPIQKKWIENLKNYPEHQGYQKLGTFENSTDYQACCLGELLLCYYRYNNIDIQNNLSPDNQIIDVNEFSCTAALKFSYKKLGLSSPIGELIDDNTKSLAGMNDGGWTWPQIAEFVENNPEKVFTKSV